MRRLRRQERAGQNGAGCGRGLRLVKRAGRWCVGAGGAFLCAVLGHIALNVTFFARDEEQSSSLLGGVVDVSPDGCFLVFGSQRVLTGVDTRGGGAAQGYVYDTQTSVLTRGAVGDDGYSGRVESSRVDEGDETEGVFYSGKFCGYREGDVRLFASVVSESGLEHTTLHGGDVSGLGVFFSTFEARVAGGGDAQAGYCDARVGGERTDGERHGERGGCGRSAHGVYACGRSTAEKAASERGAGR
jgi:hypothetical protein